MSRYWGQMEGWSTWGTPAGCNACQGECHRAAHNACATGMRFSHSLTTQHANSSCRFETMLCVILWSGHSPHVTSQSLLARHAQGNWKTHWNGTFSAACTDLLTIKPQYNDALSTCIGPSQASRIGPQGRARGGLRPVQHPTIGRGCLQLMRGRVRAVQLSCVSNGQCSCRV